METQKTQKIEKTEKNLESVNVFKKRSEMTKEDLKKLKFYTVVFREFKNGTATFVIDVVSEKLRLNDGVKDKITLDFNTWNLIKLLHKKNSSFAVDLPVRFVKGIGKTGKEYYLYELYVASGLVYSGFIPNNTLRLLDTLVKLNYLEPIKFEELIVDNDDDITDNDALLNLFN